MVIAGRKANRLFKARFPHPSHLSASPIRGAGLSCGRCLRRVAWEPSGLRSTAWPVFLHGIGVAGVGRSAGGRRAVSIADRRIAHRAKAPLLVR